MTHLKYKGKHIVSTKSEFRRKILQDELFQAFTSLQDLRKEINRKIVEFLNEVHKQASVFEKLILILEMKYKDLYSNYMSTNSEMQESLEFKTSLSKFDFDFSSLSKKVEFPSKVQSLKDSLHKFFLTYSSDLRCFAVSQDEKFFVTGGFDSTVRVWNIATSKQDSVMLGHKGIVNSISISNDSTIFLSGAEDKTVRLWDFIKKQEIFCFNEHKSAVVSVYISASNKYAFSASDDSTFICWHLWLKTKFFVHKDEYPVLCVKSVKQNIYFGTEKGSFKVLNLESGKVLNEICAHKKSIFALEFSKDQKLAVTGGLDGNITFWDIENFGVKSVIKNGKCKFYSLALDTKAELCAAGSSDCRIYIWNVYSSALIHSILIHYSSVFGVYLNRRQIYSLSKDSLSIFNTDKKQVEKNLMKNKFVVKSLAISNNLQFLACAHEDLILYDLKINNNIELDFGGDEKIPTVNVFSHDSSLLFTGYDDGSVFIRSVSEGRIIKESKATYSAVKLICVSQNTKRFAYFSEAKILRVVNFDGLDNQYEIYQITVSAMIFEADNLSIIFCDLNGEICIVNGFTYEKIYSIKKEIKVICYSEDNLYLFGVAEFNYYFCIDVSKKTAVLRDEDQEQFEKMLSRYEDLQIRLNYS